MQEMERDLQNISKSLNNLARKINELATRAGSYRKGTADVKRKATKKRRAGKSPSDVILDIIKRKKKGIDNATLREKTGFSSQQVRDSLYRLSKKGKIQRVDRGFYKTVE